MPINTHVTHMPDSPKKQLQNPKLGVLAARKLESKRCAHRIRISPFWSRWLYWEVVLVSYAGFYAIRLEKSNEIGTKVVE